MGSAVGAVAGSSPLARGLRNWRRSLRVRTGIIPARAGFTSPGASRKLTSQDHPRSRGVYFLMGMDDSRAEGSSPLARGLRARASFRFGRLWIIPARAGFTRGRPRTGRVRRDHPRSRGVYRRRRPGIPAPQGSSPLARGLPEWEYVRTDVSRIIPARAGFTQYPAGCGSCSQDHPRSRGVYSCARDGIGCGAGSSPLARGLPGPAINDISVLGIIPARAGFTHKKSTGSRAKTGSSPLARGLLSPFSLMAASARIIPARAGFTQAPRKSASPREDHPRSRGVYTSSRSTGGRSGWIIPARAGFTHHPAQDGCPDADHPRSRGVYPSTPT